MRLAATGFVNNIKNMRLREEEKSAILAAVKGRDRDARVVLFGSRVDDSKRGGDIDLFVVSEKLGFRDEWCIRRDILDKIGWQKLDLIIRRPDNLKSGIARVALGSGVTL